VTDWRSEAACRDKDTKWFYADSRDQNYRAGRQVCADCPVKKPCLDEAMHDEAAYGSRLRYGLRGGLSPEERQDLAQGRARYRYCRQCGEQFMCAGREWFCSSACYHAARAVQRRNSHLRTKTR
jgi:WhiB family redox-sensing transcriptional regulator